jgi:copper chaperone CopZ
MKSVYLLNTKLEAMNVKIFVISFILMLSAGFTLNAQNVKTDKETVVFEVSMTCENCQKRIEKNIAFEKGVTDMKVNLENKTVTIVFKKSQTTVEKLQEAIKKLGYEVTVKTDKKETKK